MSSKSPEFHPVLKWTVILYAMGLTAIGYKTLENQNGSILNYIKRHTTAIAGELPSGRILAPRSKLNEPRAHPVAKDGSVNREHEQHSDNLSQSDRRALNSLVDNL